MSMKNNRGWVTSASILTTLSIVVAAAQGCGGRTTEPGALADQPDSSAGAAGGSASFFPSDDGVPALTGAAPPPAGTSGNTFTGTGCLNGDTACTNCIDDDGDGFVDALDSECTGPLDNDEATFATGIAGDNIDFCHDCFFDGNSGHGDDGCEYNTECLYGRAPSTPARAACFQCEVSSTCRNSCAPFTPNGCDCFGCCTVFDSSGAPHDVLLGERCSLDTLEDPAACEACVPTPDCYNDCEPCELCIGRPAPGPECDAPEAQPPPCTSGGNACDAENACPSAQYCLTGCCIDVPVIR